MHTLLPDPILADPVLSKYRSAVLDLYASRIERAVLYGSRARDDGHDDSDYDIALFLNDLTDRWDEGLKVADIELAILDLTDAIVQTHIFPAGRWRDSTSPLMSEIRKDGIDLL